MTSAPDRSLTVRALYGSSNVSISDYTCRAPRSGPAAEEHPDGHNIVLLRRGVFRKHVGRHAVTANTNHAVFFTRGSSYRVSHPVDCGNRGTIFSLAPEVLLEIIGEFSPACLDHPENPFPFAIGPCETAVAWRHQLFVRRLQTARSRQLDPIWVDETAMQMMADVLAAAFGLRHRPMKHHRKGTLAEHRDRTEAAKSYLASRVGDPVTIDDVARAVHTSPFHLSRIFRQYSGQTLHRYLIQLRLRASLERLADGASDLTQLALELGFSSHGHFAETFRREFGRTPSSVRAELSGCTVSQVSKNLEA